MKNSSVCRDKCASFYTVAHIQKNIGFSSCWSLAHPVRFMMQGQKLLEVNGPHFQQSNNIRSARESILQIAGLCTLVIV